MSTDRPIIDAGADERLILFYGRVSTEAQDLTRQRVQLDRAQADNPGRQVRLIEDDGVSAYKVPIFEREGGKELCHLIEAGRVEKVYADAQDRLSRGEPLEWLTFAALAAKNDTRIFLDGNEVRDDDAGVILGVVNQLRARGESADKSHRISGGKLTRAEAGLWPYAVPTLGYRLDKESGVLHKTKDAPAVNEAFRRFAEYEDGPTIRADLAAAVGQPISRDRFRDILSNATYIGQIPHPKGPFDGRHRSIVTPAIYKTVQTRLASQKSAQPSRQKSPFSRILRCGKCHQAFRFRNRTRGENTFPYYECRSCPRTNFAAEAVEANFVLHLNGIGLELQALLAENPDYAVPKTSRTTVAEAQQIEKNEQEKLDHIALLYADSPENAALRERWEQQKLRRDTAQHTVERLSCEGRSYRDELKLVADRIEASWHRADAPIDESYAAFLRRVESNPLVASLGRWPFLPYEEKRELLQRTFRAVYVYADRIELDFHTALPQVISATAAFPVHRNRKDDTHKALQEAGFGVPPDTASKKGARGGNMVSPTGASWKRATLMKRAAPARGQRRGPPRATFRPAPACRGSSRRAGGSAARRQAPSRCRPPGSSPIPGSSPGRARAAGRSTPRRRSRRAIARPSR